MNAKTQVVTLKGKPVTLVGNRVDVGDHAPAFTVVGQDLSPVSFAGFRGRPCIISSVVSLDTEVCDTETRRFNEAAAGLSDKLAILTISADLPFAQKRWCGAAGIERVTVLSDHRDVSFGTAYGVLIKELRLLARAVFVIDSLGVITYKEIVGEVTHEPDYERVLGAARQVT